MIRRLFHTFPNCDATKAYTFFSCVHIFQLLNGLCSFRKCMRNFNDDARSRNIFGECICVKTFFLWISFLLHKFSFLSKLSELPQKNSNHMGGKKKVDKFRSINIL